MHAEIHFRIFIQIIIFVITESGLGVGCINGEPANQCSVTNTECIADSTGGNIFKCLCMAGYYSDSTCKACK